MIKVLYFAVVAMTAYHAVDAHPICIDSTAPYKRANAQFAKCPQYNQLPTCASPAQENSVVVEPTYGQGVTASCKTRLKAVACASLDQWSGHMFRAEGPGDSLEAPMLCKDYCTALYSDCSTALIANSPFVEDSTALTTIASVFSNSTVFCDKFADSNYCYEGTPFTIPTPAPYNPNIDLCVETVLSGGEPKANMQPVPGYTNLMMIGDLSGVVKIYTVDPLNTGSAFTVKSTLLNIKNLIDYGGERGLLGVALHKNFSTNGRFYVSFSCLGTSANIDCSNGDSVIDEYRVLNPSNSDNLVADPSTRRRIFQTDQPYANHNGGQILFSPDPNDPHLYMMLGDGGSGGDPDNRAQPLTKIWGKILRIDVDSTFASRGLGVAPADNPVYTDPFFNVTGALPLIWTNGMRNPWRCSFDMQTHLFYCGDVGQDTIEEVDIITKGGNYGWSKFEGNKVYRASRVLQGNPNPIAPIMTYTHDEMNSGGYASVTGGYVVRSNRDSRMSARYIFADLSGPVFLARESPEGSGQWTRARVGVKCAKNSPLACNLPGGAYSFGEMASGDILYADGTGDLWRFVEPQKCGITPAPTSGPHSLPNCRTIKSNRRCRKRSDCRVRGKRCIPR